MRRLLWSFVAVFLTAPAFAGVSYEPLSADDGTRFLLVSGNFDYHDSINAFVAAVTSSKSIAVTFNSPGGNVSSAMMHGRMIRALGLNTIQIKALECSSACALAFMGGVNRMADAGAIGVHQTSFASGMVIESNQAVAAVQETTADILEYLEEMGVDSGLLKLALRYQRDDMRYLSSREMVDLRVTTSSVAAGPVGNVSPKREQITLEEQAFKFVSGIVEAHTGDATSALNSVARSYSTHVRYYGRAARISDVVEDKRAYFDRWPERAYRIQNDTVSVNCRNGLCEVRGLYSWAVRSLPRNKKASGVASFSYVIDTSNGLSIVAETSEVVSR